MYSNSCFVEGCVFGSWKFGCLIACFFNPFSMVSVQVWCWVSLEMCSSQKELGFTI